MKKKLLYEIREIGKRLPYFLLAVVILGGLGVILPLALDYFKNNSLTQYSLELTPNNLITYSISIFLVALVDRISFLLKHDRYKHKVLEFLILVFGVMVQCVLVFLAFQKIFHQEFNKALKFSLCMTAVAYFLWWVVRKKDDSIDPYSALGA